MSTILPNSISFKDHEFSLLIKKPFFFPFLLQSLGKLKVLNLSGSKHLSKYPASQLHQILRSCILKAVVLCLELTHQLELLISLLC